MFNDIDKIKDDYGQGMYELCCGMFGPIIDSELSLYDIIKEEFGVSKTLYHELQEGYVIYPFMNRIYANALKRAFNHSKEENTLERKEKNLRDILDEYDYFIFRLAGNDGGNFGCYYYWDEMPEFPTEEELKDKKGFILIKKNAPSLDRTEFTGINQNDAYAKSVILVTYEIGNKASLRLVNRYGKEIHNNLEMIAPGLTLAFEKEENLGYYPRFRVIK